MKNVFKMTILALILLVFGACVGATPTATPAAAPDAPATPAAAEAPAPAPAETPAEPVTINLYSGGSDNVRVTWEYIIAAYAEVNPNVNVQLQFIPSGAGMGSAMDVLVASIRAGQATTDIDILEVSEGELAQLVDMAGPGALVPLTVEAIPNMANVAVRLGAHEDLALPFRGTTVVMAYNSEVLPTPPASMTELKDWIRSNPTRFAYNDPTTGGAGGAFVRSIVYNEMPLESETSADESWMEYWEAGFEILAELHPYMYMASGRVLYPARNQGTLDLLATGEVDIIPAWADMALQQISEGILPASTRIYQIDPPLTGNIVTAVIPSHSEHHAASLDFLNFLASPTAQDIFVRTQHAIPVLPADMLPQATIDMLAGFNSTEFRAINIGDLGSQLNERWLYEIATLP